MSNRNKVIQFFSFALLFFIAGFLLFKETGQTISPGGCWVEDGSGYKISYDMTYIQANCDAKCNPVVINHKTYYYCYTDSDGQTKYSSRNGTICANACSCLPTTRSCNERCMEKDTCLNGSSCVKVGNPNEYRCRNTTCSSETDCDCATGTPTPTVVTTTVTPSPIPTAPACNYAFSMNYSNACNLATFELAGVPATHKDVSNNVTGLPGCFPWIGSLKTCDLTGNGSLTWKHDWQECDTSGTCRDCTQSKTITPDFITLSCSKINDVSPHALIWDENNTVNISYVPQTASQVDFGTEILNLTTEAGANTPVCNRTSTTGTMSVYDCNVTSPVYPEQLNWNLKWTEKSSSCPGIIKPNCSDSFTTSGKSASGYFKTLGGDVYIKGDLLQSSFPKTGTDTLATYSYSTSSTLSNSVLFKRNFSVYSCYTAANYPNQPRSPYCSEKNQIISNAYSDDNNAPGTSWYEYLYKMTSQLPVFETLPSSVFTGNYTDGNVLYINGYFSVPANSNCKNRNIFLVNGDLELTPDFKQTDPAAACLFIVKGTTTIHPYPGVRIPLKEDIIKAFFITQSFTSESKGTGDNVLRIQGGVATEGNTVFNRNINTKFKLYPNNPSEIIDYDGARYFFAFKDILSTPSKFGIRELGLN